MSDQLNPEQVRKMKNALRLELPDAVWQDVAPVFDMLEDILTDIDIEPLRESVAQRARFATDSDQEFIQTNPTWGAVVALVAIFDHHQPRERRSGEDRRRGET